MIFFQALYNLGTVFELKNEHEAAKPLYRESLLITEHVLGENADETKSKMFLLAQYLNHIGDIEDAEKLFRQELVICEKYLGFYDTETQQSLHSLGVHLRKWERYDEAEQILRKVVTLREQYLDPEDAEGLDLLADSLNELNLMLAKKSD